MKRSVVTAVFLFALVGLAGCPIYDHENAGCYRDGDCAANYVCNQNNGDCVAAISLSCAKPSDCDSTATCAATGLCVFGDCTFNGCIAGYSCSSGSGVWECAPDGSGAAGSSGQGGESGASAAAGQGGAGGASGAPDAATGGVPSGG